MRTQRNEANVTMAVSTGLVIRPDYGQTGIFSSCSRVGLEGACMETSDFAQVRFKFLMMGLDGRPETDVVNLALIILW